MKRLPTPILVVWLLGVAALPLLLVAGVAGASDKPGTTCASGKFAWGGSFSVPLPTGDYDIAVKTWDQYPTRATSWPGDQTSESVTVAGRTTPDLADGVESADWSGSWRWSSGGTLTVVHAGQPGDADSVSWEVCATPVEPEPAPTTTTIEDVPEPESGEVEAPVEVLPETVVAEPVEAAPAFTG